MESVEKTKSFTIQMNKVMKLLKIGVILVSLALLTVSPVAEAGETRVEETDPSFVWTGSPEENWASITNAQIEEATGMTSNLSGGTAKIVTSGTLPCKADITFTGTGVALIYFTHPAYGIATVEIDNVFYDNIDMYSSDLIFQVKTVIATDLDNTQHVLTVTRSGTKNPASAHWQISIDAIDVYTSPPAVFSLTLTFQQNSVALANTSIYYGFSSGQETNFLGTTDNEGKITSSNTGLADKTIYFKTSDGEYAGSVSVGVTGGEVTAELTEAAAGPAGVSELPILLVAAVVVIVVVVIGALLFIKKKK